MSIAEKITGLLARPSQPDSAGAPDVPWYMLYGSKILGIVGSFFAILFGLFNALTLIYLSISCFISGTLQILIGFVVMSMEVPACFFCFEFVGKFVEKVESRPMYYRAAFYCLIALPPVILCPGLGSIFGCGMIFGTGVIYGMMSLGRKASAAEMRQAAVNSGLAGGNAAPTTSDRANIINNAQPFSFTGGVGTDSNV